LAARTWSWLRLKSLGTACAERSTRRAFVALHKAYPEEQFYVFGLCGNSGGQSISLVANTIQSLAERAEADLKSRINECATVEKAAEEARWHAGSWPYFDKIDTEFREVNSLIDEHRRSLKLPPAVTDDASEQFMEQLHEVCTQVLEGLNEEGFFGKGGARSKLTVLMIQDDIGPKWIVDRAYRLNPKAVAGRFEKAFSPVDESEGTWKG
jgi:hypothetical protein